MIILTIDTFPGREFEVLGLVYSTSTRASNVLKDKLSGIRDVFGGKSSAYKEVLEGSLKDIHQEISQRAIAGGADAVVGFRVTSTAIGGSKMLSFQGYGTAIRFVDQDGED